MNFPEILHHWPHCFLIGHKSRDDHGSSEKFRGSASKFSHIYCFVCGSRGELAVFALFASDQFDDWDPCTQFLFAQTQSMWSIFHLRVLMTFKTLEFLRKTFNRTLVNGKWYQFLFSFSELKRFYFSHKFGEFLRDVDDDEDPNWKRKRIGGKVKSWRQLQSMHFSKSANYWSVYQVKWTAIPFLLIFSF